MGHVERSARPAAAALPRFPRPAVARRGAAPRLRAGHRRRRGGRRPPRNRIALPHARAFDHDRSDRGLRSAARRRRPRGTPAVLPPDAVRPPGRQGRGRPARRSRQERAAAEAGAVAIAMTRIAVALVGLALRCFPSRFRATYAADMEDLFAQRWRDASGSARRLALLMRTLANLARAA